jgi:aminopeptidase N
MSEPQAKRLCDYKAPSFTISHVDLSFQLDPKSTSLVAVSQVKRLDSTATHLTLDGEDLELVRVCVNDDEVTKDCIQRPSQLIVPVELENFELRIQTRLNPKANTKLEGLYVSDGSFCTQCEAEGFRRMTFFLDRPDVLATFKVRLEAEKKAYPYLLSNGNPIAKGDLEHGRHFVVWEDPFPKSCYLFALVAGDFDCLEDHHRTPDGREILLQIFVDKGQLFKAQHAMRSLQKSMVWDEQRFGLTYDLDIYMIVAVDFFNMGAMENKGLNVFNSKFVLADESSATDEDFDHIEAVIGHEYFHNWTGNRVTCRDWFQLSLKEGLTVFRDQEFSSDLGSRTVNRIQAVKNIRQHQFAEDAGPMAHPIRPESVIEMNNFYTTTVYEKGAEVIRMMHTLLGEQGFQQGMKLYFERHDGQAVTCEDFVGAMEDATQVDLQQFRRWYSQAGTPEVALIEAYNPETQQYSMTFRQHTKPTPDGSPKEPLHIPIVIELLDSEGQPMMLDAKQQVFMPVLNLKQAEQTFVFEGIQSKPIPCLFCGFSAPIKLSYAYETGDLVHIMQHATHELSRWDASQTLAAEEILRGVACLQAGETHEIPIEFAEAFGSILEAPDLDLALMAEIFKLPTESNLAELMTEINIELLHESRKLVRKALAHALEKPLFETYMRCQKLKLQDDVAAAARALQNVCLSYLAYMPKYLISLVKKQYQESMNMTDQLGALQAANIEDSQVRNDMLNDFEKRWISQPLVMDKWFAIQATLPSAETLNQVRSLMKHKAFTLHNPNRVRALIGSFVMGNPAMFHAEDGSGYEFLSDQIKVLNEINPQVAARLITPLTQWKKQPEAKQSKMKHQLQTLLKIEHLAKDIYEKTYKSLQQ